MNFSHLIRVAAVLSFGVGLAERTWADEQRSAESRRAAATGSDATKLDLNTADVKALEAVPVIGPDGARAIIAARPFATIDELDRVQGINTERLEQIRAKVTVAPAHVPSKLGVPSAAATTPTAHSKRTIDLNSADRQTLESIPTITPAAAQAIIAARPFTSVDDLSRVKGISAEQLEQIRAQVTVQPAKSRTKR